MDEYVSWSRTLPPQPKAGLDGQMHAVWTHKMTREEKEVLKSGNRDSMQLITWSSVLDGSCRWWLQQF